VLRARIGGGWVQIEDLKEPGYWVQPGFSGTPIWDEQLNGVVGIAVAADRDRTTKAGFMIPARELITACPSLTVYSLEAGSLEHLQVQLARLAKAQRQAADPARFQPQIRALQDRIATWDQRVERQHERIVEGLQNHRQQMTIEQVRRRETERLHVVGQPPLDVTTYFKDRQRDQERILQFLAEPTTRLVSVIGHGGMGKTALACKVLQDLEHYSWPHTEIDEPLDGIVYLSTRTGGISLERLFLDGVKLLGEEEQERLSAVWTNLQLDTREKVERLLKALRRGRYVILLDNLEDLLDDGGRLTDDELRLFFEQMLTTGQGAQLVVTSRIALTLRREVLRFDRQVKLLEGLPTADGVLLLRELDPNGDYGLRDAPAEQLAAAVELTHGVPRALEILAGILAYDPFVTLEEVLETFYEQEDVVQALIEENYRRLDQDSRHVMDALAVFRRPVPVLAVDYLLEPFVPGLDVPIIVRRLTQSNIVSVDRAAKTVTLHPIDQDYAYSRLPEEGGIDSEYTRQALERRAADYYAQLRTPEESWEALEDLEPQLHEFEHHARAGEYDAAARVLHTFEDHLRLWGHYKRLHNMHEGLYSSLTKPQLQSHALGKLGYTTRILGNCERAIEFYEKAVSLDRKWGDRRSEAMHLGELAFAYRTAGRLEESFNINEMALKIAREISDLVLEGDQLNSIAGYYYRVCKYAQAIVCYKDALIRFAAVGDRRRMGETVGNLGFMYHLLGQLMKAKSLYMFALEIGQSIGHLSGIGTRLANLSCVHYELGNFKRAIQLNEEALGIALDTSAEMSQAISLHHLGDNFWALGKYEEAEHHYRQAVTKFEAAGGLEKLSAYLSDLGKIVLAKGDVSEAWQYCYQAYKMNIPRYMHMIVIKTAYVSLHKDSKTAANFFQEAKDISRSRLSLTTDSYIDHYVLAHALLGEAVCSSGWSDKSERPELLAPALDEYRRALEITAAPGVVLEAKRDLELIQAAGIEGLEPVFELLESAEYVPDSTEDLDAFLAEIPLPEE
jgi:tetratricopeptide (TPR) repeat protein